MRLEASTPISSLRSHVDRRVVVALFDARRGAGERLERPRDVARDRDAADDGQHEAQRRQHDERIAQPLECRQRVAERAMQYRDDAPVCLVGR